jgi:transcriptional regulator with XRE-family HTH domain
MQTPMIARSDFFLLRCIANCDINIAIRHMTLGEKLRYLRQMEGTLRGLSREMTQQELVRSIKKECRGSISQSYLSQIENGSRRHLTNDTRLLLANFFKVHPGYLVDDPEGFHTGLISDLRTEEQSMDLWLINGAETFRSDPELCDAMLKVARHEDSRKCFILLAEILDTPGLADRLLQVLKEPSV